MTSHVDLVRSTAETQYRVEWVELADGVRVVLRHSALLTEDGARRQIETLRAVAEIDDRVQGVRLLRRHVSEWKEV
jgi:hypothetical protein